MKYMNEQIHMDNNAVSRGCDEALATIAGDKQSPV